MQESLFHPLPPITDRRAICATQSARSPAKSGTHARRRDAASPYNPSGHRFGVASACLIGQMKFFLRPFLGLVTAACLAGIATPTWQTILVPRPSPCPTESMPICGSRCRLQGRTPHAAHARRKHSAYLPDRAGPESRRPQGALRRLPHAGRALSCSPAAIHAATSSSRSRCPIRMRRTSSTPAATAGIAVARS